VTKPILYVKQVLDNDHNGLIFVKEALEDPVFSSLVGKPYSISYPKYYLGEWNRRNAGHAI
jgi:hypothetical protein